eukprot:TRINITY_DN7983_c0_g1_i2.p1 TRINITY_DN7983_c0_g1~~TRINITY_DN7983_c0_g1_i2.p1  ORF type:complete len:302 (+),score=96.80 TRINITY_DN7983_c0_g1_i2:1766-2671(+)
MTLVYLSAVQVFCVPLVWHAGAPMVKGVIARFVEDRGFGFIRVGGAKDEVFFHKSAVAWKGGIEVGTDVEFEVVQSDGKTKARNIVKEGEAGQRGAAPGGGRLVFESPGRVSGVALFLLRDVASGAGLEVLLWHVPAKSLWESSGYYTEPSDMCSHERTDGPDAGAPSASDRFACFRRGVDAADETRTDLVSNNPTSRAVAVLTGLLNLPPLASFPHISVFQPSHGATQAFQNVYVVLPGAQIGNLPAQDENAEPRFDGLRWLPVRDVIDKTTGEKILQHTEQRVHLLSSNRKVKHALGLD